MNSGQPAFWHFSLRFYQRPEVAATCLHLQDQYDIDVNLLFFMFFLALHQRQLTAEEVRRIDARIGTWRAQVVQPLRAIRRTLKSGIAPVDTPAAEALRSAIKCNELQAERLQQETLEREFPAASTGSTAEPRIAAIKNVAAYSTLVGTLPPAAVDTLLTALTAEFSV